MREEENNCKTYILIVTTLFILIIEQKCQYFPANLYCEVVKPSVGDPEPAKNDFSPITSNYSIYSMATASETSRYFTGNPTTYSFYI